MSVATNLQKLSSDISNAYSAIETKGGTIPSDKNTNNLLTAIRSIPQGGTSTPVEEKDVNYWDYDGTLLYSYTASEFQALTSHPTLPTHTDLTADDWTISLANAKTRVSNLGGMQIGALYKLENNYNSNIRITINIDDDTRTPHVRVQNTSTTDIPVINWGDGTTDSTSRVSGYIYEGTHTYSTNGKYVITVSSLATINIAESSTNSLLVWDGTSTDNSYRYRGNIESVELYNVGSVQPYGLADLRNMKTLICNINSLGRYALQNCYSLKCLISNLTAFRIGSNYLSQAFSIETIILSNLSNTTILGFGAALTNLKRLELGGSNVVISDANTFNGINSIKKINIPDNLTIDGNSYGFFVNCNCLEKLDLTQTSFTKVPGNLCDRCYSLIEVKLPRDITSIEASAFRYCYSIGTIEVPCPNLTNIGATAFRYCYNLKVLDFRQVAQVPTLANTNAFSNTNANLQIIVPNSLYDTWIAASNWSTYASHIVKASDYTE